MFREHAWMHDPVLAKQAFESSARFIEPETAKALARMVSDREAEIAALRAMLQKFVDLEPIHEWVEEDQRDDTFYWIHSVDPLKAEAKALLEAPKE